MSAGKEEDNPSEGPISFRKATRRRANFRKHEDPVVVEKKPIADKAGDKSDSGSKSDSNDESRVVKPKLKRKRRNPLSATVGSSFEISEFVTLVCTQAKCSQR